MATEALAAVGVRPLATDRCVDSIPQPIVTLNRSVLVGGVSLAFVAQQPLLTLVLFIVVLGAALFGRRGSAIHWVGSRLLASRNARALAAGEVEDRRLVRFNNAIAATMLGAAQLAYLAGLPLLGWIMAGAVALAAAIALAGFCVGCMLYTQFKLHNARLARIRRA